MYTISLIFKVIVCELDQQFDKVFKVIVCELGKNISIMSLAEIDALNAKMNESPKWLDQKPLKSLTLNKLYYIRSLLVKETRYGKSVLAQLCDKESNEVFQCWLPARITEMLSSNIITEANNNQDRYALMYQGEQEYPGLKSRAIIKFHLVGN